MQSNLHEYWGYHHKYLDKFIKPYELMSLESNEIRFLQILLS